MAMAGAGVGFRIDRILPGGQSRVRGSPICRMRLLPRLRELRGPSIPTTSSSRPAPDSPVAAAQVPVLIS